MYVVWVCWDGGLGSEKVDLIYVVGTRVTVKLCPDVAKIQSLKNTEPQIFLALGGSSL